MKYSRNIFERAKRVEAVEQADDSRTANETTEFEKRTQELELEARALPVPHCHKWFLEDWKQHLYDGSAQTNVHS